MDNTDRHAKLLQAQEAHPPTLTLREMGDVLDINSLSHVRYILDDLVAKGMAEKIQRGKKNVYRMITPHYNHRENK